jgi:hypothetical protein
MPSYRKPPIAKTGRPENASFPEDSPGFSIETTTMRLKSLKLRRAEAADRELEQRLRETSGEPRSRSTETGPAGRVRHDERGVAVWDMAVASGEFAALSASNVMRKLEVADLKIEDTLRTAQPQAPVGGGGDPYNTRAATQDPFRHGAIPGGGGDPYNQRPTATAGSSPSRRPAPGSSPKKSGGAVLDQLTGKKK